MWPISRLALVMMTENERERNRERKKEKKKNLPKKAPLSGTAVNIWGISGVKIFLEFSHLLRRKEKQRQSSHICRGEREAETVSNRYHPWGLTAAITLNCSLKTTLFALLGDKVIIHCCTS